MTTAPMGDFNSTKKWPEGAIEDWQHGASYGWLAEKYGRAYSTVAKFIRHAQELGAERVVDVRKRKGGRTPLTEQTPLSRLHLGIGLRLSRFREIDNCLSCEELGRIVGANRMTIRKMELGLHDFTLNELKRISCSLEIPIEEFLQALNPSG